jgi:hypothetical protein
MSLRSDWRRLKGLGWPEWVLLGETVITLAVASLAIRALPFRIVVGAIASRTVTPEITGEARRKHITKVRWAVEASARRLPWRIVCFQKGLAVQRLLARRGIPTALHYGVAQDWERGLIAHVWVTHGSEAIIGGEEAPRHTCLATYPPLTS